MKGILTINCDNCFEDISVEFEFKDLKDTLNRRDTRNELEKQGWHDGIRCLCPKCKEKNLNGDNCLNCKHFHYNDYNYRCSMTAKIVTKYDCCDRHVPKLEGTTK